MKKMLFVKYASRVERLGIATLAKAQEKARVALAEADKNLNTAATEIASRDAGFPAGCQVSLHADDAGVTASWEEPDVPAPEKNP